MSCHYGPDCPTCSKRTGDLRERAARALWEESGGICDWDSLSDEEKRSSGAYDMADAVIAALPLIEERPSDLNTLAAEMQRNMPDDRRRYVTLWERIEEDG